RNVGSGDAARPVTMGNWLGLRLSQDGGNRDAIGAWIEVQVGSKVMRREMLSGGGHAGGQRGWTHLGLGPSRTAQVRVQWPEGELGAWRQVDANQYLVIAR